MTEGAHRAFGAGHGSVISLIKRLLKCALARTPRLPRRRHVEIPACRQGGGTLRGVGLDNGTALVDLMEGRPAS
jgi:hypothetical protein